MQYYECDVPWWWLIMTTTTKMFLIEKSQVILVSPNLKLNPNPNDLFYKSALTFRPWNAKQLFFIFFLPLDTLRWFEIFPLPAEPHGGAPGHEAQLPSSSSQGNVSNKKEQKRKHCQHFGVFFAWNTSGWTRRLFSVTNFYLLIHWYLYLQHYRITTANYMNTVS